MGIVGGVDEIEAEALPPKILDSGVQLVADDLALAQPFFFAGAFFALGAAFASALASAGLRPGSSFTGLAGLGLAEAFSTEPFAGSSATSSSSSFAFALDSVSYTHLTLPTKRIV